MPGPPTHRVLSVIHGLVFGGAHNQLLRLDPGLREAGFETVAVVPPRAAEAAARLEASGIEVVRIELSSFRRSRNPGLNLAAASSLRREVRQLRSLIRGLRAEIVQVHGVVNPQAGIAGRLERTAIVWQLLDSRAPMAVRRAVMPFATRVSGAITSWGRGLAAAHPGALAAGERLIVVYPPVDPSLAPDPAIRERARNRLALAPQAVAVGTLGVRHSQKGHEHFVRAAAIVKREHPETAFRVIGDPSPNHAEHMAAVEAEARAAGLLGPEGIAFVAPGGEGTELLQGLDVFAMTSIPHSEGMPTAILEAMACAKPVVSTAVGSVDELVEDGVTGFLSPPLEPGPTAAAIGRLAGDADLRASLGAAGRSRAQAEFPLDRLVDLHARAYALALSGRGRVG